MKKKSTISRLKGLAKVGLFTTAMAFASSVVAQDITTGLLVNYTFESIAGGVVVNNVAGGNDAIVNGAPTVGEGYNGNALNFPLQADYLQLPNGMTSSLTDFTVATWVKFDQVKQWSRIFDFGSGQTTYMFLTPQSGGSTVRFAITTGGGGGEEQINGASALPAGAWTHVAVTLQGSVGKLYVNGVQVGVNNSMTLNPAALGETTQNYIAKSQYPDPALTGSLDDFRIYNRALSSDDVLTLVGYPGELVTQWKNLTLGDLSAVENNITLPTTLGSQGVIVEWASSVPAVISTTGVVTRPEKYDQPVVLTASVKLTVGEKTHTLTKEFNAVVLAQVVVDPMIAYWDFKGDKISIVDGVITVTDATESGFVGSLKDVARIRTIGQDKFNVLDLGNNKGHFNMGEAIGEAIYSLGDFSIGAYYRIDDAYAKLNDWGNLLWSFSNSENVDTEAKGTMYFGLKNQNYQIAQKAWFDGGEQGLGIGSNAAKGAWHHVVYVQSGSTGTIYVDGVVAKTGTVNWLPSSALRKDGLTGTKYNYIGRPNYANNDVYLRETLVYGFQMFNVALTADDVRDVLEVNTTLTALNNAYAENPDYVLPEINAEAANLSLGDISAVTGNLTLPSKGTLDNTISISWKSNHDEIINGTTGAVVRPDYHPYTVKLTATLFKNGQYITKTFDATVLAKEGTGFNNDLLVNYDFSNLNGSVVNDVAEKTLTGTLQNEATIRTIGTSESGMHKVLDLGNGTGYFDMGEEVGKIFVGLSDYTVGAFFRIDNDYEELNKDGNFLWNFSNSADIHTTPTGYIIGILKSLSVVTSPNNWDGEVKMTMGAIPDKGGWHHFAYKQSGTTGTIYLDGSAFAVDENMTRTPVNTVYKDQMLGTLYNWIGRSCYTPDVYLRKTLVADFRLYGKALTDEEVMTTKMNVANKILALDNAYAANPAIPTAVTPVNSSNIKVLGGKGAISIVGLNGTEKVSVFDITGRQFKVTTPSNITLPAGIYVLKVDNYVTKVVVR